MDTSSLLPTDGNSQAEIGKAESPVPLTSAIRAQSIQPGLEWFTRLLAPLTRHTSSGVDQTSAVTATAPTVEAQPHASSAPQSSLPPPEPSRESALGIDSESMTFFMDDNAFRQAIQAVKVGEVPVAVTGAQQDPWVGQPTYPARVEAGDYEHGKGLNIVLLVFIPILAVVLTILLGLLVFLVAMLYMRKKRGIKLTEDGGPLDLSKGDGVLGEGGTAGVEARWLETVDPDVRDAYRRAKEWQSSYPPSSVPTDITLSQFLSIQEKGVSAWSFEPDYEDNLSLYVQSRTEITFLADGPGMAPREGGGNSVMANLPLPKVNEVYYWEVKLYDKAPNTEVAIGLATKPYPSFRLPGWSRYSVAYFASDGFKSHNYPFTASSHGPPLNEGDVLGVGYRPRTGTVFFTRNGRKMEDAYAGLQRFNLFPVVGANGPCTLHVNLGQAGFVFIEANVKKWGLAPMVGTLAPPPAYGSERGSILLDAGYGTPGAGAGAGQGHLAGVGALLEAARNRASANQVPTQSHLGQSYASASSTGSFAPASLVAPRPNHPTSPSRPIPTSPTSSTRAQAARPHSSRRHRRAGKSTNLSSSIPVNPSPLRGEAGPGPSTAGSRRRALTRQGQEDGAEEQEEEYGVDADVRAYASPTDAGTPYDGPRGPGVGEVEDLTSDSDGGEDPVRERRGQGQGQGQTLEPESPIEHNPPTPNPLDFSLHSLKPRLGQYFPSASQINQRRSRRHASEHSEEDEEDDVHEDEEDVGYDSDGSDGQAHLSPRMAEARLSPGAGSGRSGEGSHAGSDDTVRPSDEQRQARDGAVGQSPTSPTSPTSPLGPPSGSPPPPGYAPLDPHMYAALPADLPEDLVNQAIAAMSDGDNPQAAIRQGAGMATGAEQAQQAQQARGPMGWFRRGG